MKRLLVVAALAALSGCATIDTHVQPDPAWPRLKVTEHEVSAVEMLGRCYRYLSLGMKLLGGFPLACAEFNLEQGWCRIYYTSWATEGVKEHERLHCEGFDHPGSTQLTDHARAWRAGRARR